MEKRYKVIFCNLLKKKAYFKDQMLKLGVSETVSEEMLKKAPVTMKKDLSLKEAREYADAVYQAGGRVRVTAHNLSEDNGKKDPLPDIVTLKNFTMCPQCGYKQIKTETCVKCGFLFARI